MTVQMYKTKIKKIKQTVKHMAKNDDPWTRSPSRINLKIIFLQNYQFFMNYAKGPIKIHLLEAEKKTFDPWSIKCMSGFFCGPFYRNFRNRGVLPTTDNHLLPVSGWVIKIY